MLAGDVLLTEAFEVIANAPAAPQICVAAARALGAGAGSRGMVYGQELDLKYEALSPRPSATSQPQKRPSPRWSTKSASST